MKDVDPRTHLITSLIARPVALRRPGWVRVEAGRQAFDTPENRVITTTLYYVEEWLAMLLLLLVLDADSQLALPEADGWDAHVRLLDAFVADPDKRAAFAVLWRVHGRGPLRHEGHEVVLAAVHELARL